MKPLISVVAPMYNEEQLAHTYCQEMKKMTDTLADRYDFEIVLVNDGSKDRTWQIIQEEQAANPKEITAVCLSRNFGLEGAVHAGLVTAKGDAVVVMDADLQDPPALIPEMIAKWEAGADIVVGSRIKRSNDSFFKKAGAGLYYKVLDFLSGKLKLEKSAANFRLLSRKAVDQVLSLPEVNGVFRVVVPFVGMKTDVIEYDRDKRFAGKTKYNLKSQIPYALDSITGISVEPLRKIMYLQAIPILFALICLLGCLLGSGANPPLWIILLCLSVFFEIVMLSLAIMAEYIGQIMTEVKGRPVSIIYETTACNNAKEHDAKSVNAETEEGGNE